MLEPLDPIAVNVNVILPPERCELGAEPAKLVHELADFGNSAGARRIHSERADHEAGDVVPIVLRGPDFGVIKHEAQDVTLSWMERAIVGKHNSRGPIPGDDIPGRRLDQRGTALERIEQPLQTGRDSSFHGLVPDLGWTPEPQQEEMFALPVSQQQGSGDPVQHLRRRSAAAPLLQPRVPGRADVGALGDFLPA